MAVSSDYVECEFPVSCSDGVAAGLHANSVDYGQFLSFLETKDEKIICLQEGRGKRVSYDSPCLPLAPPSVCSPYHDVEEDSCHAPGASFKTCKTVSYLYTNHPEDRLPLHLLTQLINEPTAADHQNSSAMTFVPCNASHAHYIGYLVFASGPDLCTLTVGGVSAQCTNDSAPAPSSFADWSHGHAPLSLHSIEAYTLPGQIRHIHFVLVQGKVMLCCRSNYHVTLFEMQQAPPPHDSSLLQCVRVYSSDSPFVSSQLSPYIAGEFLSLDEAGAVSLFKGTGEILPIPSHGHQFILCCYGNQPRSLLLATPTNIFAFDIRESTSADKLVTLFSGSTDHTLFLLDTRQPEHALLAVEHQLSRPPASLSCTLTDTGDTMVLLTSAKHCESVVVCYSGRHTPPYFTICPHSVSTPSELSQHLLGFSCSSLLPLTSWRFSHPASGSALISLGEERFAALLLTSLGDLFYQCWHYQSEGPLSPPLSRGQPNSPSLHLGYSLWLKEAGQQQQALNRYDDLPNASIIVDMDPLIQYLVYSQDHLCLNCYYAHTQHFSQLDLDRYLATEQTDKCSVSTSRLCRFCSDVISCSVLGQPPPGSLSTSESGLERLRSSCAVREPRNELEVALVSGWTMGGAELQRNLLEAANSPPLIKREHAAEAREENQFEDSDKATPTQTHRRLSAKTRKIGF